MIKSLYRACSVSEGYVVSCVGICMYVVWCLVSGSGVCSHSVFMTICKIAQKD